MKNKNCCVDKLLDYMIPRICSNKFIYDITVSILGGFVAAVITWMCFTYINPAKVNLCLRYGYEYKYEGASQDDPIRIIRKDIPIRMNSGQNLWIAILNTNLSSLEGCTLHLQFAMGLK